MLKKRLLCMLLAVLSFVLLTQSVCAFSFWGLFGNKDNIALESVEAEGLKMYLPTYMTEPIGGYTAKTLVANGGERSSAELLYDKDIETRPSFEKSTEVILDMGMPIFLSHIRYYADKLDYKEDNNCLGTRFFASKDNRNYVELAVIEVEPAPENNWYTINFSGFGEYRYFKAVLPERSNICEIEWHRADGVSVTKRSGGKYDIKFNLIAFDAERDTDARVLLSAYNEKGKLKNISSMSYTIGRDETKSIELELKGIETEVGDNYRVVAFDEGGLMAIPSPLNYKINDASNELSLSSVFTDNMLVQADKPFVVWGTALRGQKVEITLKNDLGGGITVSALADANGKWEAKLGSFTSGGSYTLTAGAGEKTIQCKNITFGDVWLCAGQSNMDYYMSAGDDTEKELKNPDAVTNNDIRVYNLFNKGIYGSPSVVDNPPMNGGIWETMSVESATYCSAIGYYFSRSIYHTTNEPVGIISVAVGDTEINRWAPNGDRYGSFTSTDGDMYNNRIHPFERLQIKGILFYQGEADQYRTHMSAEEYSDALSGLVDRYREIWGADLPFYWTQLTRYKIDESLVREGQRIALSKVREKKNTGMVVLNDIFGNYRGKAGSCRNDIHPWDKKTVAERFARFAKRDCYGQTISVSGPVYKSSTRVDDTLVLNFECDGELRIMPKERYADKQTDKLIKKQKLDTTVPREFEVAGEDMVYYPADARIDGCTVILKSEDCKQPIYARYAWGAYPEMPNLTDDTGLPTATFDTAND